MNMRSKLACQALFAVAMALALPVVTWGQETPPVDQPVVETSDTVPPLTAADVEAALAAVESDPGIDEESKATLRTKYGQIAEVLEQANGFADQTNTYKDALETAPKNSAQNREQLKALPSIEAAGQVDVKGTSADVRKELETTQATLQGLSDELTRVSGELLKTEARPVEIAKRLPQAQRELSETRDRWEGLDPTQALTSATEKAERLLLRAESTRLVNEIAMLQQEQLSQSVREEELESRRELLSRQVENAKARFDALTVRLDKELTSDVDRIGELAKKASEDLPGDAAVQELAAEVRLLAEQFQGVVENLKQVAPAGREVKDRLEEVGGEYRSVKKELSLGSGGREVAQVLLELARRARPGALKKEVPISVESARLDWYSVKKKQRAQAEVESQFADQSSQAVQQLVAARREILDKHQVESGNLTQALAELQTRRQQYFDLCDEVQTYVSEVLFGFGVRSCPPIGLETLTGIPAGLMFLFRGENLSEVGTAFSRMPIVTFAALLSVIILLLMRRRLIAVLERTGPPTRRTSTDHYSWTAKALFFTSLLAAPVPILVGLTAWVLAHAPNPSEWMIGLAAGSRNVTSISLAAVFMYEVCRPGGLGIVHFRWKKDRAACASWALKSICAVYVPTMILAASYSFGDASQYFDSVGRTAFILVHVWVVFVLWRTIFRKGDVIAPPNGDATPRLLQFWQRVRGPLLVCTPLVLIVLACYGYLMTAGDLSIGVCTSAGIIAGGQMLLYLTKRWFEIRQRKLLLAEAIEKRRARLAAASDERAEQETEELLQLDEKEELGLNLDVAGGQTVAVLRLVFNLGIIAVLYSYWSSEIPLTATLDTIPVPLMGGLSLLQLAKAFLVGIVTWVTVRNLPGLLEVSVLRTSTIETGTRNAIYTLCQYAVIGLALIAVSNTLNLDWAKFGWMAAALSVGLGFGLQEVVANFVCGLIVLFERPIRVGDVVTIEGTTGTVTNINMRATTVTNWDRQDLVVPNKNLITGTILNWTLSNSLNRVVIPVGVAYGADTEQACQILLAVAADHPKVLDEPKPLASFEQFADSSLNLILRCYLPSLDGRIGTITELHTEIMKRFKEAGIEIPFPQQDLHLRSGWDKLGPGEGTDESHEDVFKPH